ncbi:hypothetical protein A6U98_02210 [Rhizobium sp. WYCCWR10014]|nr:hypothetical protein A6U98_02210 [Rhizobium sp. WYCCWR10014]
MTMSGAEWAISLGTLTLMCWIGAGLVAVILGTNKLQNKEVGKGSQVVTLCLTAAGLISAVAMAAAIVLL